ncbi:MAG: T9SS type A sorting domain-containing protein [Flavobacteriales bacterium]|nr:T9SS type A sorting domain-containing protein [Flavobacteriales bacterium]
MKYLLPFLFPSLILITEISAQPFAFASHTTSSEQSGTAAGIDVVTDQLGFTYVVGNYDNTVNFDALQIGGDFGTMFVAKYHPDGHALWVRAINGNSNNRMVAVDTDHAGNLYVTGAYSHTNSFTELDFGTFSVAGNGSDNTFIAKIDTAGNWLWVNTILSTGPSAVNGKQVSPYDLVWTSTGAVMAGRVEEQVTVDGNTYNNSNDNTFFFAKFDTDGNLTWFRPGEGLIFDLRLAMGSDGLIYFTGNATSSGHGFDGNTISLQGGGDVVFGALNSAGALAWWKTFGHMSYNEASKDIALDGSNNIYLTSSNPYTLTMEDTVVATIGSANWYLLKFNSTGNFQWMQPLASGSTGRTYNLLTTTEGISYLTGAVEAPEFFTPAVFWGDTVGALGSMECFFAAYASDGAYFDVHGFEFTEPAAPSDVREFIPAKMCFGPDGSMRMTGSWRGAIDIGDSHELVNPDWPLQEHMFLINARPDQLFDHSTGLADHHAIDMRLQLYPNPATDAVTVVKQTGDDLHYRMVSLLGNVVQSGVLQDRETRLPLTQLSPGVYLIHLTDGRSTQGLRFVKQ